MQETEKDETVNTGDQSQVIEKGSKSLNAYIINNLNPMTLKANNTGKTLCLGSKIKFNNPTEAGGQHELEQQGQKNYN